jgi:hypothetical protein
MKAGSKISNSQNCPRTATPKPLRKLEQPLHVAIANKTMRCHCICTDNVEDEIDSFTYHTNSPYARIQKYLHGGSLGQKDCR